MLPVECIALETYGKVGEFEVVQVALGGELLLIFETGAETR